VRADENGSGEGGLKINALLSSSGELGAIVLAVVLPEDLLEMGGS
jgi:hypothetical protein